MVDIEHLNRIRLVEKPRGQMIVANCLLTPNYRFFAKVDIQIENLEKIPRDENVIFAMNHTDRYNYWPFQWKLWTMKVFPYTTVWVKGKYYRNALLGKFLDGCNLIPVPSMAYLIEEFYRRKFGERIDPELYRDVKDVIDGRYDQAGTYPEGAARVFRAWGSDFVEYIRDYYDLVMERIAELSRQALFDRGLNLIIFPEGTRSVQLADGKTGLAQLALWSRKKIVPIGCNNSEQVYRGHLPFARSGQIVYRVGDPLSVEDRLKPYRIDTPFKLFSRDSQRKYRAQFEGVTHAVMTSIGRLLDERYRK
ncbi:MAG TPA: lysophospholipid acyltransferase family protein [Syntrophales bacterium]|jgi:1-acyl-sn-glycerol-3-phosphate acyltransferase|nr:lysophospholipid acyltransferase family protein [Syntrophales bacterium]HQA82224.1 lysophospholipid acyltransferase family protein [Syntrophales bacterium]